jgi:hypothetical protein
MDNLAAAATTSDAVLQQLVATNAKQHDRIESLLGELKRLRSGSGGAPGSLSATREKLLVTAIQRNWAPGGFCSTHGHAVAHGHTSATCKKRGTGHVATATRDNPAGPGATLNKGWDDGIL